MQDDPRNYTPRRPGKLFTIGWIGAVLILLLIAVALVRARDVRIQHEAKDLEEAAAKGRRVLVTKVEQAPTDRSRELPATVHGFEETPIYAKIAGYLKSIAVDKGDRVKEGQVLALLESPELDQQVANARAAYQLDERTDKRNQELVHGGIVSQQEADQSHAALLQAQATLEQLEATRGYKAIRAPFSGIVTARFVDPGALIPQATSGSSGSPIVSLATLDPVRVYAEVPQSVAPFIHNGDPAVITVEQFPGREFKGTVTRHPEALQPATRTMVVEVDVQNGDHTLLPGMYASARFSFAVAAGGASQVPDDALIFRGGKVYLPIVRGDRLNLSEVTLGYDDGRMVEITSGVNADDVVAINVGQAVHDGEIVQPVEAGGSD